MGKDNANAFFSESIFFRKLHPLTRRDTNQALIAPPDCRYTQSRPQMYLPDCRYTHSKPQMYLPYCRYTHSKPLMYLLYCRYTQSHTRPYVFTRLLLARIQVYTYQTLDVFTILQVYTDQTLCINQTVGIHNAHALDP